MAKEDCEDKLKINDCETNGVSYACRDKDWAAKNCARFCGLCVNQNNCTDKLQRSDCGRYNYDHCRSFPKWAKINCAKFCNLCDTEDDYRDITTELITISSVNKEAGTDISTVSSVFVSSMASCSSGKDKIIILSCVLALCLLTGLVYMICKCKTMKKRKRVPHFKFSFSSASASASAREVDDEIDHYHEIEENRMCHSNQANVESNDKRTGDQQSKLDAIGEGYFGNIDERVNHTDVSARDEQDNINKEDKAYLDPKTVEPLLMSASGRETASPKENGGLLTSSEKEGQEKVYFLLEKS